MNTLAVCFPGQGSQERGMGRDVAEFWSEAMDVWRYAESISKAPLREIFWDGTVEEMARTEYLQPAMTVVNLTLHALLKKHAAIGCYAGHSLGEFAAISAAEVLTWKEVLEAVTLRGRLMSQAGATAPGSMAAVLKLDRESVERIIAECLSEQEGVLLAANDNSPVQIVISGEKALVDAASAKVKESKGKAIPLPVSGGFHSPLMADAAQELSAFLERLTWRTPKTDIYFNVTAETQRDPQKIRSLMQKQMTSSVLWRQTVQHQWRDGVRLWIECGPKGVLTRLLTANLVGHEGWRSLNVDGVDALERIADFLKEAE